MTVKLLSTKIGRFHVLTLAQWKLKIVRYSCC